MPETAKKKKKRDERILIVDDNVQNIKLLGTILKNAGYRINVAANGTQALEMVEAVAPDLVLLDIMMPGLNGYETCEKLKSNLETADIPVIFLSAKVEPEDVVTGFRLGGADYITKPYHAAILLARINTHISLMKKNKQLKEMTHTDGLTMIANRRHFDDFLRLEWRRCLRNRYPITLIMLDIDHFKFYNDYYGHLHGDDVLKKIAHILNELTRRPGDLVARYGGEEFAAVLGDTDSEKALKFAHNMCREIRDLKLPHEKSPVSDIVTASIGVISTIPDIDCSPEELLERADKRLYEAKTAGRNQVKGGS